jgi:hypothetical protein
MLEPVRNKYFLRNITYKEVKIEAFSFITSWEIDTYCNTTTAES